MFTSVTRKFLVPVLLLAAAGQARPGSAQQPAPEAPPPPLLPGENFHGSVTLPYAELRALWLAAQPRATPLPPAPVEPPLDFALRAARYSLAFADDLQAGVGEAEFDVQTFSAGWTAVPLLGSVGARLESVEPADALITVQNGFYTLLSDKPGAHPTKLRFAAPLVGHDAVDGKRRLDLSLETGASVISELTVTKMPAGWAAEIPGATLVADTLPPAVGETHPPRYQLPPESKVALTLARPEEKRPVPAPVQSVWRGEAQSLVRYGDGRLLYRTHLRVTTEAGAGLTASLVLPVSVSVLSVVGDDLAQWHSTREGGEGAAKASRRVDLTWKTPDLLRHELILAYERPQLLPAGDWELVSPGLSAGQGRLESAVYVIPAMEGLEFTAADPGLTLTPGVARLLPRWTTEEVGSESFVLGSVASAVPAGCETGILHARQLPLVQTVKATVEESQFDMRLVTDGALLNKGTWIIRHDAPLAFAVTLPPGAQLLTCSAQSRDVAPVDRGNGNMEIPLPGNATDKPTVVTLSYTDKQPALAPVSGQAKLTLPKTSLFVKSLRWDLQIPGAYELVALEGNVTQILPGNRARSDDDAGGIHLGKELLNGEQPSVELFYQKRSVNP